jgi:hypothetical protein
MIAGTDTSASREGFAVRKREQHQPRARQRLNRRPRTLGVSTGGRTPADHYAAADRTTSHAIR